MTPENTLDRLSKYALGSAALFGGLGTATAEIIHRDVPDTTGTAGPLLGPSALILSFNSAGDVMTTGTVADEQFRFGHMEFSGGGKLPFSSNTVHLTATGTTAAANNTPLAYGTMIGPGETIDPALQDVTLDGLKSNPSTSGDAGPWTSPQRAFIGLKFDNAGIGNYGWADITVLSTTSVTLHGFAYEDTGGSITAGAVPEPSQVALLALGAAGVLGWRARQRSREG